jgi:hypothetical protein
MSVIRAVYSVPSERLAGHRHNPTGVGLRITVPVPTPRCPNCSGPMALSHKFQPEPDGPRMHHFHCTMCKVGLTVAEKDNDTDE